jgi:N-hydroxyarylamine O-acetyltransferase
VLVALHVAGSAVRRQPAHVASDGGRAVTIAGRRLIVSTDGGARSETELAEGDVVGAYKEWFGIELDALPAVKPVDGGFDLAVMFA